MLAPRLRIELDAAKAFILTTQAKASVGYILAWSFDSGDKLDADLSVPDPDNLAGEKKVVAILGLPRELIEKLGWNNKQFWQGGRTDPQEICGLVSANNKAKLLHVMHAPAGGTEQKFSVRILPYDEDKMEYFESFVSEDIPAIFTPDSQCDVESTPYTARQPLTYPFRVSFSPKGNAPKHEIRCAESPTLKTVATWGGVGA
jgi:hypothetical protein